MTEHRQVVVEQIQPDGSPLPVKWDDFVKSKGDRGKFFLVQLTDLSRDDLAARLDQFDADPLILDRCTDDDAISGVFVYDRMLGLQLPIAADWRLPEQPKLTILCQSNALITISKSPLFAGGDIFPAETRAALVRHPGISGLLLVLLDRLVDRTSNLTLEARRAVDSLENDIMVASDASATRLLEFKRAIARFEITLEAKHRTLAALLAADASFVDLAAIRERLRDVISHVEHSERYVDRIEDRLSELHHHATLMLQDKTNQRLRALTILSGVFLPLTLITGIYGMNFTYMPELGWRYAYPAVLLGMLVAAVGLLLFFSRKGWFR